MCHCSASRALLGGLSALTLKKVDKITQVSENTIALQGLMRPSDVLIHTIVCVVCEANVCVFYCHCVAEVTCDHWSSLFLYFASV